MALTKCPGCGEDIPDYSVKCPKCKFVIRQLSSEEISGEKRRSRYPSLELIAGLIKGMAWCILVISGLAILFFLFNGRKGRLPFQLLQIGYSVVSFIILYAFAELIYLLIDVEDNTRRTAETVGKNNEYSSPNAARPGTRS